MKAKYKKIMIIDDNEIDNYIVKTLLRNNNIADEVIAFDSAVAAIEYLQFNQNNVDELPQIIFLDLYMPIMDGFQFIEMLDNIDSSAVKDCKLCVLSSSIDNNDIIKSKFNKSVFTYIAKPISTEFLLAL